MSKKYFYAVVAVLFLVVGCGKKKKEVEQATQPAEPAFVFIEGFTQGTIYHIVYEHPQGKNIKPAIEKELERFNNSLSTYIPTSTISKVNQNLSIEVDTLFERCFQRGKEISKATNGAFDMTVMPLVNAWGFGFKNKENITRTLVDSLQQTVGWQKVNIENRQVVKQDTATMLDASAIAKGYGVDVIAMLLDRYGCKNFMVEIGGEVSVKGKNKKGKLWRIGINQPKDNAPIKSELQAVVELNNQALATSGNYRNFYIEGGKKFAHTIDPQTGYPVQHSLLSATVVAADCMTADAYATSFMVMGMEKAKRIVKNSGELEAFFIYADDKGEYKTWISEGLKKQLKEL
ncbi:FAD:protein FMN transferase [Prolixibacteraceae bacterium JC049]|nr:FAD:protein FMN transferase [Prolixibacteraceae bacterium JC049]